VKFFIIKFGVVNEASRISYHEWQQSIGLIWNKHWTFGIEEIEQLLEHRFRRNVRLFPETYFLKVFYGT
jgi:hypothetical protein